MSNEMTQRFHRLVRQSNFRHVFGQCARRGQTFDDLRLSRDGSLCAVNPKFLAVSVETGGGGAFLVIPVGRTGRVGRDRPLVTGHSGPLLDMAWCPHDDNVIASGSEDTTARVWQVSGSVGRKPLVVLEGHCKRVGIVTWHPTARNVLLTAGGDNRIIVWNAATGEPLVSMDHPDHVYSVGWNRNGSRFVSTCRDRRLRVCDPRKGEVVTERLAPHESAARPTMAVFTRDGNVFTTGFTRSSQRELALWDPASFEVPVARHELDAGSGVMSPHYDPDTNMVYLSTRGESSVLYFEITEQRPFLHYLGGYTSKEQQRGAAMGFMPKRGLDVTHCEIARLYRLLDRSCEPVSMTVPRKSELFQADLYPDAAAPEPAMELEEWLEGRDEDPVLVSMRPGGGNVGETPKSRGGLSVPKKNVLGSTGTSATLSTASSSSAQLTEKLLEEIKHLKTTVLSQEKTICDLKTTVLSQEKTICDLKTTVLSQEKTISDLENKISQY